MLLKFDGEIWRKGTGFFGSLFAIIVLMISGQEPTFAQEKPVSIWEDWLPVYELATWNFATMDDVPGKSWILASVRRDPDSGPKMSGVLNARTGKVIGKLTLFRNFHGDLFNICTITGALPKGKRQFHFTLAGDGTRFCSPCTPFMDLFTDPLENDSDALILWVADAKTITHVGEQCFDLPSGLKQYVCPMIAKIKSSKAIFRPSASTETATITDQRDNLLTSDNSLIAIAAMQAEGNSPHSAQALCGALNRTPDVAQAVAVYELLVKTPLSDATIASVRDKINTSSNSGDLRQIMRGLFAAQLALGYHASHSTSDQYTALQNCRMLAESIAAKAKSFGVHDASETYLLNANQEIQRW